MSRAVETQDRIRVASAAHVHCLMQQQDDAANFI
jgi:hypothetical protein